MKFLVPAEVKGKIVLYSHLYNDVIGVEEKDKGPKGNKQTYLFHST